jgi:hypothetical protein
MPRRHSVEGLDLRTSVVLLASVFVGVTAGLLTFAAKHEWALAVLAGGGSVGGAAFFFDWIIKRQ